MSKRGLVRAIDSGHAVRYLFLHGRWRVALRMWHFGRAIERVRSAKESLEEARADALDHHAGWCSCAAMGWLDGPDK